MHDQHFAAVALIGERVPETGQVVARRLSDVRLERSGREPLVLAKPRRDLMREADRVLREILLEDVGDDQFVLWKPERPEQADRETLRAGVNQLPGYP